MRMGRAIGICLVVAFGSAIFGVANAGQPKHRPVLLGSGTLNGYQWSVVVARDGGKRGGQRPCLVISRSDTRDPAGVRNFSGYGKVCSALPHSGFPFVFTDTAG